MKKRLPIGAVIAIVIVSIIIICITIYYVGLFILSLFIEIPKVTDRNITTCYGDNLTLYRRVEFDFEIYYYAKYDGKFLFGAFPNYCYYSSNARNAHKENWDEIINSFKEGDVRIYELNWGMVYTTDDGAGFKGVARDKYTDYYKMDKEFAEVYSMLYEKPFYDERFKEHLDMSRYKLLDSETAEEISISKTKSIRDVEELAGKAQRCVLVDTEEGTENIQSVTFEYDLSDGRILVVHYLNQCEGNNLDLYLSHNYIREVYNPEEDQSPEATPTQPAPSSPSPSAAAA